MHTSFTTGYSQLLKLVLQSFLITVELLGQALLDPFRLHQAHAGTVMQNCVSAGSAQQAIRGTP